MVPDYFVTADGASIMAALSTRLLQLTITDKAGVSSDTIDILLSDENDAIDPPRKGAKLKAWIGYRPDGAARFVTSQGLTYKGEFTVDEVEVSLWPRHLRITGKGADVRDSLKSRKTRTHEGLQTLKKVLEKIAKDHKLEPKIDAELGANALPDFVQTEESDLHLATRLAEKFGGVVKYADGKLIAAKRGAGKSASGKDMPTITLNAGDIKNGRGRLKDRMRYGSASAAWHDQGKTQRKTVTEKKGEGPNFSLRETYQTEAEARAACKAALADAQRRSADLSLTTPGRPEIAAEAKLILAGVSRKLDGDWIVDQARDILKGTAPIYETQIEAKTPDQRKDDKANDTKKKTA